MVGKRRCAAAALLALSSAACLALVAGCASAPVQPAPTAAPVSAPAQEPRLQLLGMARLPTGLTFRGTEVGGLSALTYDAERGVYYALSDDRSRRHPARFYTLRLDLSEGRLGRGDVEILGVTLLRDEGGEPFEAESVDPEGMALAPWDRLFISSEGVADEGIAPFVREVGLDGTHRRSLAVPGHYRPSAGGGVGVRSNLGFEPLALGPGATLVSGSLLTGSENALAQDGPAAAVGRGSPSRLLRLDLESGRPTGEFLYPVEPVAEPAAEPGGLEVSGLTELLALGGERYLALERSFSMGAGFTIRLYEISLAGATDLAGLEALTQEERAAVTPVGKTLLLDLGAAGIPLDNLEGMSWGPRLPDGRRSLILVSDNNFNPEQVTLFLAFAFQE